MTASHSEVSTGTWSNVCVLTVYVYICKHFCLLRKGLASMGDQAEAS